MTATGNREVHNLLSIMVLLLPATWSLLMPPACFPSRFWVPRHAQVAPKMRCQGSAAPLLLLLLLPMLAAKPRGGRCVLMGCRSYFFFPIGVTCIPSGRGRGLVEWQQLSRRGRRRGRRQQRHRRGRFSRGAMGEGDDAEGASDTNACSTQHQDRGEPASSTVDMSGGEPKKSASFGPWVWLSAMWGMYAAWLRRSPLVAKAVTSGVLGLSGDMAAQFFEFQQKAESGRRGPFLKNTRRLTAVAIDSILITGPALHALYGLLECLIPTAAGGFVPAALHVAIDTFVFDPMFVASFFCVTGMLESRPLRKSILPGLRREFWPAVQGSWLVSLLFCPLQFATFRYLP